MLETVLNAKNIKMNKAKIPEFIQEDLSANRHQIQAFNEPGATDSFDKYQGSSNCDDEMEIGLLYILQWLK